MFEADETDDLFTPSLTEISEVPSPPPRKREGGRLGCALRTNRYAPRSTPPPPPYCCPYSCPYCTTRPQLAHNALGKRDVSYASFSAPRKRGGADPGCAPSLYGVRDAACPVSSGGGA